MKIMDRKRIQKDLDIKQRYLASLEHRLSWNRVSKRNKAYIKQIYEEMDNVQAEIDILEEYLRKCSST